MYKRNGNKGITLIALVITIIVLLILAGVSIAMLTGDNSILANATKARRDNAISSVKEQVLMAINTTYTDYHVKEVTKEEHDSLVDMTKAALQSIESNQSEVEYHFNPETGVVSITYTKDSTIITGKLDLTTGAFRWE